MQPFSNPKAGISLTDSLSAPTWPQRKDLGPSPEFAIGLVARDGKPKGTQDRTVPCTTAKHQFTMANITAWTLTRSPEARSQTANTAGELALVGTDDSNCKISNIRQTAKCYNPRDRSSAEK